MRRHAFTEPFLNWGHALDHLAMLIFPTAVLAIAPEMGLGYEVLLPLSVGGFVAFGVCALPAGWLADRWSRRAMMSVFFFGIGAALILTGFARTPWQIAACLTLVGLFAAIYHPVGIAMVVTDPARVGRALGINGVAGNLGVAAAAISTGVLCDLWHWRAAFMVPGGLAILSGLGFLLLTPVETRMVGRSARKVRFERRTMVRIFSVVMLSTACGGIIFNATIVGMPKLFDERIPALAGSAMGVGAVVSIVYVLAAMAQLLVGWMIDRWPLKAMFVPLAAVQPLLLWLAGSTGGWPLFAVATAMMFVAFGLIPVHDAIIARYTDERWRSRVYAVKYVVSFGASSVAVPLIAVLHGGATGEGFGQVYLALGFVGVVVLIAALVFPARPEEAAQPQPAPALQGA